MLIYHKIQKKFQEYYDVCKFTVLAISTSSAENDEVITAELQKIIKGLNSIRDVQDCSWKVFLEVQKILLKYSENSLEIPEDIIV